MTTLTHANFDKFQCTEFASGDKATPTSPIAPDLESGAINKNGTAVVIVFNCNEKSCPPDAVVCPIELKATENAKILVKRCFVIFKKIANKYTEL